MSHVSVATSRSRRASFALAIVLLVGCATEAQPVPAAEELRPREEPVLVDPTTNTREEPAPMAAASAPATPCDAAQIPAARRRTEALLFPSTRAEEFAFSVAGDELQVEGARVVDIHSVTIGDRRYAQREDRSLALLAELSETTHLGVRGNELRYRGCPVRFPPDVVVRDVYEAIRWGAWVVVAGRTSRSDSLQALFPPALATELFWFRVDQREVGEVHTAVPGALDDGFRIVF